MAAGPDGRYGVYWVGKDGNTWVKSNEGHTSNWGKFVGDTDNGFTYNNGRGNQTANGWRRIEDWAQQPQNTTTTNNNLTGGSYSSSSYSAAQAAADAKKKAQNEATVNQGNADHARTQTVLDARLGNAQKEYDQMTAKYNQDMATQRNKYNEETHTNETNLAKNKQNALVAQARGLRGLRSALAAAGALSGDGEVLMNRAVKQALEKDVNQASDAYATNAAALNSAWQSTEDEDKQRREDARAQYENNRIAAEAEINKERSAISKNIANAYRELGNNALASQIDARGAAEADAASRGQGKQYSQILEKKVSFTPAELEQYLAGMNDMRVKVGEGETAISNGQSASLAKAAADEEKKKQLGVVERV